MVREKKVYLTEVTINEVFNWKWTVEDAFRLSGVDKLLIKKARHIKAASKSRAARR